MFTLECSQDVQTGEHKSWDPGESPSSLGQGSIGAAYLSHRDQYAHKYFGRRGKITIHLIFCCQVKCFSKYINRWRCENQISNHIVSGVLGQLLVKVQTNCAYNVHQSAFEFESDVYQSIPTIYIWASMPRYMVLILILHADFYLPRTWQIHAENQRQFFSYFLFVLIKKLTDDDFS